ncbi:MAG: riboflavin biosynthesis protein RibF, partial [Gammaproteobacteria bacterium]|nr:riboflavin biosynthesis protein RibF [Gammaproteobacteria bacterium]
GIDYLLVIRFNGQLRNMSAEAFIERVFINGLNVAHLIMGDDSHFGRGGEGDVELLRKYGEQHNFKVVPTKTCAVDGERVSSSRIRQLLEAGELGKAERLLGRPYTISGKVIYGRQLGRTLGAPTANIALHRLRAAMAGVYAVEARICRQDASRGDHESPRWHAGVANVGTRPTLNESIEAMLEVHLLDYAQSLYGARLEIRFLQWLREEQRFESLDLLKQQIQRDIDAARQWFASQQISTR